MLNYCVNRNQQSGGEHEVHNTDTCKHLPNKENQLYLGNFPSCKEAIKAARAHYDNVDGCKYCSEACHSR